MRQIVKEGCKFFYRQTMELSKFEKIALKKMILKTIPVIFFKKNYIILILSYSP